MAVVLIILSLATAAVGYVAARRVVGRAYPGADSFSLGVIAGCLELAVGLIVLMYCAERDYRLALGVLPALAGGGLLWTRAGPSRARRETSAPPLPPGPLVCTTARQRRGGNTSNYTTLLIVALLAALATRLAFVAAWPLPIGWDPSFHCLLASRIQETHAVITDWSPYVPVPLNYPITPHIGLAALADVTGVPVHHVFSWTLAMLTVLSAATVYPLARSARATVPAAACAVLLFLLSAWMGSTFYMASGTYSNLLGLCFLIPALALIAVGPIRGTLRVSVLATLLTAAMASHHHVMLTTGLVLVPIALWYRRRDICLPFTIAVVLSAPVWLRLLRNVYTVHSTETLTYAEEPLTPAALAFNLGVGLTACLFLALFLWLRKSIRLPRGESMGALVVLVTLFLTLDYGCRLIAQLAGREPFTLFSAARFMANAVPMLCVVGGVAIATALRKPTPKAVLLVTLTLSIPTLIHTWRELYRPMDTEALATLTAADWIRKNTATDAYISNNQTISDRVRTWMCYLTRRRTTYTPLPASEPIGMLENLPSPALTASAFIDVRMRKWVNPNIHHPLYTTGPGPTDIVVSEIRRGK